jgi:hypothetical protein
LKRLIIMLCLGLAASSGAIIGAGHGTALAQVNAGNANACVRHTTNNGHSYAYDLTCTSLTLTGTPGFDGFPAGTVYTLTYTGSGLLPGSAVNQFNITSGNSGLVGFADGSGNFSRIGGEPCSVGSFQIYLTGTAANGTPVTSATVSMPPAGACF